MLVVCVSGFFWGVLLGLFKMCFQVNEIVIILMFNIVVVQVYCWLVSGWLCDFVGGFIVMFFLLVLLQLLVLLVYINVMVMLLVLLLLVWISWLLFMCIMLGYEIWVVGQLAVFVLQVGLLVQCMVWLLMGVGGVLVVLVGMYISYGLFKCLLVDLFVGFGYEGLLVVLLVCCELCVVLWVVLMYVYLCIGVLVMECSIDVLCEVVLVIQVLVILFLVVECMQLVLVGGWLCWCVCRVVGG